MTLWKYRAIPMDGSAPAVPVIGRLPGDTAADVRAALRRAGLQPLDLRPLRAPLALGGTMGDALNRHLRARRRPIRAELFDGLATMLKSGLPLLEAVDALSRSRRDGRARDMLLRLREALRSGRSLSESFVVEPAWFDPVEVAMVRAGEHGGTLADVLLTLADRHERSGQFTHQLLGALAYPAIVTVLGLGVVVFLSTTTLPELVRILRDAGVEPPRLTLRVLAIGSAIASSWMPLSVLFGTGMLLLWTLLRRAAKAGGRVGHALDRLRPAFLRRRQVGGMASGLSELLRAGVPLTEALSVLVPTAGLRLGGTLSRARSRIEHGSSLADAFDDEVWFDAEFVRLLDLGHATGELPVLLTRIGERYQRSAQRALDRFAALLEPLAILFLAALVGTVALAAVLPLFRLQEVLR